jgi:4-hydroxybenzoate polyprenyltransferase
VVAIALPAAWYALQVDGPLPLIVPALFLGWSAYALSFAYAPGRGDVGGAIGRLIAGIALLDAVVITSAVGPSAATGVALAAFATTVALQRRIEGT